MIFIILGSREYQFNRLLKEIDNLIKNGNLKEEIFAQIGQSTYIPKNYKYIRFLNHEEFAEKQAEADLIISHAGTGALISGLKLKKQIISVPRLSEFNEHIDDHQLQVSNELFKAGYLYQVVQIKELEKTINMTRSKPIDKEYNNSSSILSIINLFIEANF